MRLIDGEEAGVPSEKRRGPLPRRPRSRRKSRPGSGRYAARSVPRGPDLTSSLPPASRALSCIPRDSDPRLSPAGRIPAGRARRGVVLDLRGGRRPPFPQPDLSASAPGVAPDVGQLSWNDRQRRLQVTASIVGSRANQLIVYAIVCRQAGAEYYRAPGPRRAS